METAVQEGVVLRPARTEDLAPALALLESAGLPAEGVAEWLPRFVVAERGGAVVGVAGLEVYGPYGLLRSVAVSAACRGLGLGSALTADRLSAARSAGLQAVYLLTDTAEGYFPRHGFRPIERNEVPHAVQQSVEFRELCPASSAVMVNRFVASG